MSAASFPATGQNKKWWALAAVLALVLIAALVWWLRPAAGEARQHPCLGTGCDGHQFSSANARRWISCRKLNERANMAMAMTTLVAEAE